MLNMNRPLSVEQALEIEKIGKKYIDDKVDSERVITNSQVETLLNKINENNTNITGNMSDIEEKIKAEELRAIEEEIKLDDKIANETSRATNAENILSGNIDSGLQDVRSNITKLTTALNDEKDRATKADQDLTEANNANRQSIEAEVNRAKDAEEKLQKQIDGVSSSATETNSRIDNLLQQINDEVSRSTAEDEKHSNTIKTINDTIEQIKKSVEVDLPSDITSNTNKIASETTRATQAEEELNQKIIANKKENNDDHNAINSNMGRLAGHIDTSIESVNDKISNEVTRLNSADATIEAKVDAEKDRATIAEQAITMKFDVAVEEIKTTMADNSEAVDTKIKSVTADLDQLKNVVKTNKESSDNSISTITSNIQAEVARATQAENTLTSLIEAEVTRATQAEERIATSTTDAINTETAARNQSIDTINNSIQSLTSKTDRDVSEIREKVESANASIDAINIDITKLKKTSMVGVSIESNNVVFKNETDDIVGRVTIATELADPAKLDTHLVTVKYANELEKKLEGSIEGVANNITEIDRKYGIEIETSRTKEKTIEDRTTTTENSITTIESNLNTEIQRATNSENTITTKIETLESAQQTLTSTVNSNTSKIAEANALIEANNTAIGTETKRSTKAEEELKTSISSIEQKFSDIHNITYDAIITPAGDHIEIDMPEWTSFPIIQVYVQVGGSWRTDAAASAGIYGKKIRIYCSPVNTNTNAKIVVR